MIQEQAGAVFNPETCSYGCTAPATQPSFTNLYIGSTCTWLCDQATVGTAPTNTNNFDTSICAYTCIQENGGQPTSSQNAFDTT